jgi:hypothetical protein
MCELFGYGSLLIGDFGKNKRTEIITKETRRNIINIITAVLA